MAREIAEAARPGRRRSPACRYAISRNGAPTAALPMA
jgi:hypothetical protein